MATAYGGTDAPLNTAVATSGRSPYTATASGVTDEQHHRLSISHSGKQCLNLGTGNIVERSHTIFWSGGEERTAGIGFAISNRLAAKGITPTPISDRLMSLRIQLKGGNHLTVISVNRPTMQRSQEEKEQFYEKLGSCTSAAEMDTIIILGDFNARVGKDWKSWPNVIGKHGVGKMSSNGLMLRILHQIPA